MLLKKLLDIRQESRILKEIKDIVDEIKMIKSVLGHQVEVVRMVQELTSKKPIVGEPCNVQENDGEDFTGVLTLLGNTKRRIEVMESHAKEVEIQVRPPNSLRLDELTQCSWNVSSSLSRSKRIYGRLDSLAKARKLRQNRATYEKPTIIPLDKLTKLRLSLYLPSSQSSS